DRLRPSSTRRALASLGVHPCRLARRLRRFPLSVGKRILTTIERVFRTRCLLRNFCNYCSTFLMPGCTIGPFRNFTKSSKQVYAERKAAGTCVSCAEFKRRKTARNAQCARQ